MSSPSHHQSLGDQVFRHILRLNITLVCHRMVSAVTFLQEEVSKLDFLYLGPCKCFLTCHKEICMYVIAGIHQLWSLVDWIYPDNKYCRYISKIYRWHRASSAICLSLGYWNIHASNVLQCGSLLFDS